MRDFGLYGQILWLWSNSKLHAGWPIASAMRYVIPAISTKQFVLICDENNIPHAYASWAYLNSQTELKYINDPVSLELEDWNSGDKLWFIDFIAPFGFSDVSLLRRRLAKIHGNKYLGRSIRLRRDGSARVGEHSAGSTDLLKSEKLKDIYFNEIYNELKENN